MKVFLFVVSIQVLFVFVNADCGAEYTAGQITKQMKKEADFVKVGKDAYSQDEHGRSLYKECTPKCEGKKKEECGEIDHCTYGKPSIIAKKQCYCKGCL